MNPRRTPLEHKLGTFIRMRASERDGEVVAAARAIVRTLKAAGRRHPCPCRARRDGERQQVVRGDAERDSNRASEKISPGPNHLASLEKIHV
jgi:hypothetical protein